jgi:tetratricopeptide (TPR) repeat protein
VNVSGDGFSVVAERAAPVLSDGTKLWRIERADVTADVKPCSCFEEGEEAHCKVVGTIPKAGLRAVEVGGAGATTDIYKVDAEPMFGDSMDVGVDLAGGSGARLIYRWTEGGYFCGAHGMWEGGTRFFDLAKGEVVEDVWKDLCKKLPAAVLEPALKEVHKGLVECGEDEDGPTLDEAREQAVVDTVSVSVDEAGQVRLTWNMSAEVMYACSSTYSVDGTATSGLLPEAAELGLGPVSPGLAKAIGEAGKNNTVGWARVSLEGDARTAALEAFKVLPEPEWGPASASERLDAPGDAAEDGAVDIDKTLVEARKLAGKKQYDEAVALYDKVIAADPKVARAHSGRGYARLMSGGLGEAKTDFDKALTLEDDATFQAQVLFNLGQVAEKQGDKAAAKEAYTKSLALRPHDGVQKALDRVK